MDTQCNTTSAALRYREGNEIQQQYLLKAEVASCPKLIVDCLVELTRAIFLFAGLFPIALDFRCPLCRLAQARRDLLHAAYGVTHSQPFSIPSKFVICIALTKGLAKHSLSVICCSGSYTAVCVGCVCIGCHEKQSCKSFGEYNLQIEKTQKRKRNSGRCSSTYIHIYIHIQQYSGQHGRSKDSRAVHT